MFVRHELKCLACTFLHPEYCCCICYIHFARTCITVNHTVDEVTEEVAPIPRMCILHIRPDFQGYGMNLHAERHIPGQFIGKVEPGSPAEEAGLRKGDHIIEVNDVNMQEGTHTDVVARIKNQPNMVRLLVIDTSDEEYYKSRNITIHGGMSNVRVAESRDPEANHMDFGDEDNEIEEHTEEHIEEVDNNANVKGEQESQTVFSRHPILVKKKMWSLIL